MHGSFLEKQRKLRKVVSIIDNIKEKYSQKKNISKELKHWD